MTIFYLFVGDWQAKIYCEELKDNPIFWTKEYNSELSYGCWNSVRCASFYLCRVDGVFDAWDVTHRSDRPVLSTKVRPSFLPQINSYLKLLIFLSKDFRRSLNILCTS